MEILPVYWLNAVNTSEKVVVSPISMVIHMVLNASTITQRKTIPIILPTLLTLVSFMTVVSSTEDTSWAHNLDLEYLLMTAVATTTTVMDITTIPRCSTRPHTTSDQTHSYTQPNLPALLIASEVMSLSTMTSLELTILLTTPAVALPSGTNTLPLLIRHWLSKKLNPKFTRASTVKINSHPLVLMISPKEIEIQSLLLINIF